jgi:hypothetical protein
VCEGEECVRALGVEVEERKAELVESGRVQVGDSRHARKVERLTKDLTSEESTEEDGGLELRWNEGERKRACSTSPPGIEGNQGGEVVMLKRKGICFYELSNSALDITRGYDVSENLRRRGVRGVHRRIETGRRNQCRIQIGSKIHIRDRGSKVENKVCLLRPQKAEYKRGPKRGQRTAKMASLIQKLRNRTFSVLNSVSTLHLSPSQKQPQLVKNCMRKRKVIKKQTNKYETV